ncbi:MAG: hypothetical protein OXE94_08850 [Aestuariivita sp.]|nr:hypothetical protein [Aestuariivita sp.]MCY4201110.1 hypothetical protein [Aestuariivita sp.]MCY4288297.1 hypothetical protein [Aestuariivita sp.]MCY4345941.1 hypothetical protein [Aestuariivita sp.]
MAEPLYDTHREFDRFRDAGFDKKQAEAIVHSLQTVLMGGVATKADIEQLSADFEQLELEIATNRKQAKADMRDLMLKWRLESQATTMNLKWLIGNAITLAGVIIGYLHYFSL